MQSQNTLVATLKPTSLLTKSPLEEQAFQVLTPFAFKKFQEEFKRVNLYFLLQVEGHKFTVRYYEGVHHKNHNVFWDENNALCRCKNFEFWGILCRHILRVFTHTNCFKIPTIYLPKRWCSGSSQSDSDMSQEVLTGETFIQLEADVDADLVDVCENIDVLCPPKSATKGRPRKRRIKGGKETEKKEN